MPNKILNNINKNVRMIIVTPPLNASLSSDAIALKKAIQLASTKY